MVGRSEKPDSGRMTEKIEEMGGSAHQPLLQLGLFDDLNDEGEVPVERTFGFIAQTAGTFGGLARTDCTDFLAELFHVRFY
jgi:hypothetical protein